MTSKEKTIVFTFSTTRVGSDVTAKVVYDIDATDDEIQQDFETWVSEQFYASWEVPGDDKA